MSYDVTVGDRDFNYTWNLSRFFSIFQVHPYEHMRDRPASEVAERITSGLEAIEKMDLTTLREKYDAPNGWGDVPSAIEWLKGIRDACLEQPDATVEAT